MEKYYLAVDIGASSGRHMLASMVDGWKRSTASQTGWTMWTEPCAGM